MDYSDVVKNLIKLSSKEQDINLLLDEVRSEREKVRNNCKHDLIVYFGKKYDESKHCTAECVFCGKTFTFKPNSKEVMEFKEQDNVIDENLYLDNPMVLFCTFYDETLNKARSEIFSIITDNEIDIEKIREIVTDTFKKENERSKEAFNFDVNSKKKVNSDYSGGMRI